MRPGQKTVTCPSKRKTEPCTLIRDTQHDEMLRWRRIWNEDPGALTLSRPLYREAIRGLT